MLLELSKDITYKTAFPWMDFITPVTDRHLLAELRGVLIDQLLSKPLPSTLDVLLPDDLTRADDGFSIEYVLLPKEWISKAESKTFTIRRMALWLASKSSADRDAALDASLRFVTVDREEVGSATLLDCLSSELVHGRHTYVVDDGNFYRIDPNFLVDLADEVKGLRESSVALPSYCGGRESEYNSKAAEENPTELILMDVGKRRERLLRLPNESGIELCDLLHRSGALIHVKRKGKSSVYSHLLLQAVNSCRVLRRVPEARQALCMAVDDPDVDASLREAVLERLNAGVRDLEVVFAIVGDWSGQTIADLPLFSRIALVASAQQIEDYGFIPTWKLVSLCNGSATT
jgi:uncharacterized protein (TIGR04141 family)